MNSTDFLAWGAKKGSGSGQEEEAVGFWDSTDTYGCVCYHGVVSVTESQNF